MKFISILFLQLFVTYSIAGTEVTTINNTQKQNAEIKVNTPSTKNVFTGNSLRKNIETDLGATLMPSNVLPDNNAMFLLNLDEIKKYYQSSAGHTSEMANLIQYLLALIAIISIVATILGFGVVKRNKSLHEAFMQQQQEIKEQVAFYVDITVSAEIRRKSENFYQYSQEKINALQLNLNQLIIKIEFLINGSQTYDSNQLKSLSLSQVANLRGNLLSLLSGKAEQVEDALTRLESALAEKKLVIMSELLEDFVKDIIKTNVIFQDELQLTDRLKNLKGLL